MKKLINAALVGFAIGTTLAIYLAIWILEK